MSSPGRNELLLAARLRKQWMTQARACRECTDVGKELLGKPSFEINPRSWRRWESANPGVPRDDAVAVLCAVFDTTLDRLGFALPVDLSLTGAFGGSGASISTVNRRDVLTTALSMPWLSPSSRSTDAPRVGVDDVEELRATISDLDAIDQRFGGDLLWRSAQQTLRQVQFLRDRGIYSDDVGTELHLISGSLTTSLGWFCYDAEQQEKARAYFSEAFNTATLSSDRPLAVRTLSNMARQAVDLDKPRDAVLYAQHAATLADGWAPARVHALLAVREAQGFARLGDADSTSAALLRAWRAFERGAGDMDPDWAAFLNEAEMVCLEGMCRSDLGQHQRAVGLLERSAQIQDAEHGRNLGMCLVRLSNAALAAGDLDQSMEAAQASMRLMAGGMTSTRNRRQLGLVGRGLASHRSNSRARDLAAEIAAHAA
ncbi:hypothetical protein [Streptomyces sp. NRRL B-24484]|uniref:hypothetical protein n=1 Tax=Streptomyces sp. NRRL B-24484 TaxID=1463833 RepID=UPI0004C25D61|nr:hypothetical protein [Streptomyces sp. NRRL B-24484]